jgi:creatinine amidohydrolase
MAHHLGRHAWPQVADLPQPLLAVPVGSCEQHGPHLPLDTDTRIAADLAQRLADRRPRVVVTPPIAIGASGEHAGFPGTLSIGTEVLTSVVVELVRSADWADGVVVVNGHGGNVVALSAAVRQLADEGRRVLLWSPSNPPNGDAHAGHTETSVMLALAPDLVGSERPAGVTAPLGEVLDRLRAQGVAAVSANGVLGDASGATAAEGRRLLGTWTDELVAAVDAWRATLGQ